MKTVIFLLSLLILDFNNCVYSLIREDFKTCQNCNILMHDAALLYDSGLFQDADTMKQRLLDYCNNFGPDDYATCIAIVNCQFKKIFDDQKEGVNPMQTCIDTGYCDPEPNALNPLNIVDWRNRTADYIIGCMPISILVLHHTVTRTAVETLEVLNYRHFSVQYITEKNGTIYQMVNEFDQAIHSIPSSWGDLSGIAAYSVGVEHVNTGDEPFPDDQMAASIALSRAVITRWHIRPQDIVAHGDINPSEKDDVSGFFNWRLYYEQLGIWPGLFDSALSPAEQRRVLQQQTAFDSSALRTIQQGLSDYGYKLNIEVNGQYDKMTCDVVRSFNRHFCPEVFIKETIDYSTNLTVHVAENERWYGISQERLQFLLAIL